MKKSQNNNSILFLTQEAADPHSWIMKNKLEEMGENVIIVDPGSLAKSSRISYFPTDKNGKAYLYINDELIDLKRIKSVWYRRPSKIQIPSDIHPDYENIVKTEWRVFIIALWELMKQSFWVSPPSRINYAELKPLQLVEAQKVGLFTPKTIFSNDLEKVIEFYKSCNKKIIAKKLYSHALILPERAALFSTHLMENVTKRSLESLTQCPCIFQEYIEKRQELRITIIGDDLFAISIDSQSLEETKIDYRISISKLDHSPYRLPDPISKKCRQLAQKFGLPFASIDMVVQPNGKHVFMELNPNGQWLWLERKTGLPLAKSMATLLAKKS